MNLVYLCPVAPFGSCTWEGRAEEIYHHYKDWHRNYFTEINTFRISIKHIEDQNIIMVFRGDIYLIQIQDSSGMLEVYIRFLGNPAEAAKIKYYLEVIAGNYSFTSKDTHEGYTPVRKNCGKIEIDTKSLRMVSRLDEVICCINFEMNGHDFFRRRVSRVFTTPLLVAKTVKRQSTFNLKQVCPTEEYFRIDEIKCENCSNAMIAPIFMCPKGHNICFLCQIDLCSVCGEKVADLRNSDLEDLSKMTDYTCRFEGCGLILKGRDLRRHEVVCTHGVYKCPLCCFKGRYAEVEKHFRIVHPSVKLASSLDNPFPTGTRILILNNNGIFYCTAVQDNTAIEWTVEHCAEHEIYFSSSVSLRGKRNVEKMFGLQKTHNRHSLRVSNNDVKDYKIKRAELVLNCKIYDLK